MMKFPKQLKVYQLLYIASQHNRTNHLLLACPIMFTLALPSINDQLFLHGKWPLPNKIPLLWYTACIDSTKFEQFFSLNILNDELKFVNQKAFPLPHLLYKCQEMSVWLVILQGQKFSQLQKIFTDWPILFCRIIFGHASIDNEWDDGFKFGKKMIIKFPFTTSYYGTEGFPEQKKIG